MKYSITVGGRKFEVEINSVEGGEVALTVNGAPYTVTLEEPPRADTGPAAARPEVTAGADSMSSAPPPSRAPVSSAKGSGVVAAPIPGKILEVRVAVGEAVAAGQVVAVMEAMKMENDITAPKAGPVREIRVQKGSDVATGDVIMVIG